MERSSDRTRFFRRSKGAASIALVIGLICAVFGVGGAAAGDGSYARHLREARLEAKLAGAALAHRTPEQLLLAVTPKPKAQPHAATTPAVTPTATAPTATTTPAATVTTPAPTVTTPAPTVTTPVAAATTTPSNTPPAQAGPAQNDGATANLPTGTGDTLTDTSTNDGNTGTTATDTTTTGTTTTPGSAYGVDPNANSYGYGDGYSKATGNGFKNGYGYSNGNGNGNGASAALTGNGAFGNGSSTSQCHGRCSGLGQSGTSGVVPSATPSSTSSGATPGFSLGEGSVSTPATATTPVDTGTPVNDSSTGSLSPTTSPAPTSSNTGPSTTLLSNSLSDSLSSSPALRKVTKGAKQARGTLVANVGTGGTTAAALAGVTAAPIAGGGAVTGAGATRGTTGAATASSHHADKHPASGGAGFLGIANPAANVVNHFIKVIPTAIWIALAAAFALALAFAALALRSARRARKREKEFVAISAAAQTDALTGILNRRGFMDAAERELARASRYNRPFVLAYVDVRGLKAVNDTEGHLMGDELIKTVAGLMKESARADDVVGRIGGDEFALLLGEQTVESAEPVIRRIRARVAERRAAMEIRMPWELTIGIAAFPDDGATLEELLGVADRRLYEQRGIALR
jgi:diguanylate cyclase (GGDEF)-like protein